MKPIFFVLIAFVILVYASVNYYIGLRGWQAFSGFSYFVSSKVYWILFWIISLSFIAGRIPMGFVPKSIINSLNLVGSYWMAVMLYSLMFLILIDLVRLFDKWTGFLPNWLKKGTHSLPILGLTVLILIISILVYGTINARTPRITVYDKTIQKSANTLKNLHVVTASDIHLGEIMNNKRLTKMVDMINELKPDIVFLPGDIIDENVKPFEEQNMADTFRKIKSKYGVYACLGNHEYFGGKTGGIVQNLEKAGVHVLRDSYVKVADSFYVIGREDKTINRMGGGKRKELADVMEGVDRSLPIIVLDHEPSHLEEPEKQGVDFQLSGHTHAGQLFPDRLITGRIYEVDYGYLQKGSLQVIVSSGFGTWGPPIRTGSISEIIDLRLDFSGS